MSVLCLNFDIPPDWYSEVEEGEHLRADIADEEIADDGRRDGRVRRLADAHQAAEKREHAEIL